MKISGILENPMHDPAYRDSLHCSGRLIRRNMEDSLEQTYRAIQQRIESACARAGGDARNVLLLAASKQQPAESIRALYNLGHRDFGESRVQELLRKRAKLPDDIRWHLIGHLQSNKARQIASFIHSVHSNDSFDTAVELSKRAIEHSRTIRVLIEINISDEPQKNGVQPSEAEKLVVEIAEKCPGLVVSGLMGMASFEEDPENTRPQFRKLRELLREIQERQPQLKGFTELSMGMSNDFPVAIEEGATIVRIGSALFE
jgi:pyridoxal phosphate enzyme (YggS family)